MQHAFIADLSEHVDQTVVLRGWIANSRSSGRIRFLIIRDGTGFVQAVAGKDDVTDEEFAMMAELGGMEIPLNPPRGRQQNKRLRDRNGVKAADFPEAFIVDEPLRKELK